MFALPNARHSQVAYVTNDLDAAAALFERDYAAPGFYKFDTMQSGVAKPGEPHLRIGLARVGGVEIELIEPLGSTAPIFSQVLPRDSTELAIRFHHVAIRIEGSIEDWSGTAVQSTPRAIRLPIKGDWASCCAFSTPMSARCSAITSSTSG